MKPPRHGPARSCRNGHHRGLCGTLGVDLVGMGLTRDSENDGDVERVASLLSVPGTLGTAGSVLVVAQAVFGCGTD
jgi:hypothetical protein